MANEDTDKLPVWRVWVADFFGSATAANCDGIAEALYLKALTQSWNAAGRGLPADRDALARLLKITREELERYWPQFESAFHERNGRLYNRRLQTEYQQALDQKRRRAADARRAAAARWGQDEPGDARRIPTASDPEDARRIPTASRNRRNRHRGVQGSTRSRGGDAPSTEDKSGGQADLQVCDPHSERIATAMQMQCSPSPSIHHPPQPPQGGCVGASAAPQENQNQPEAEELERAWAEFEKAAARSGEIRNPAAYTATLRKAHKRPQDVRAPWYDEGQGAGSNGASQRRLAARKRLQDLAAQGATWQGRSGQRWRLEDLGLRDESGRWKVYGDLELETLERILKEAQT